VTYIYAYTTNRFKTLSQSGNLIRTYTYNAREQLATRVITNSGSANGTLLIALWMPTRIRADTSCMTSEVTSSPSWTPPAPR